MNEPDLFDALRSKGVDADDPVLRAAVREVVSHLDGVKRDHGPVMERRCMEGMAAALAFMLAHPDVGHMESFEAQFDDDGD